MQDVLVRIDLEADLMGKTVALERLKEGGYGKVICYPRRETREFDRRLVEMRRLGVRALCFEGEKTVNGARVLGKGCVGIVVVAQTETGKVALKIRRTDADRTGMKHEAEMLGIANGVDVGPELLAFTENLLMMEFVDGLLIPRWVEALGGKGDARLRVRGVLKDVLEQCWRLDETGLDHGELSQASKHIIIDEEGKACILDFETASNTRKVANVTSVSHYLFMRGKTADLIREKTGGMNRENLLASLRMYKKNRTRGSFRVILRACGV